MIQRPFTPTVRGSDIPIIFFGEHKSIHDLKARVQEKYPFIEPGDLKDHFPWFPRIKIDRTLGTLLGMQLLVGLSTSQFSRVFWKTGTRDAVCRILRIFSEHKILSAAGRLPGRNGENVWLLGAGGRKFLEEFGFSSRKMLLVNRIVLPTTTKGPHLIGTNEVFVSLCERVPELARQIEWITYPRSFVGYKNKAFREGPVERLVVYPDALLSWRHGDARWQLCLEYDRGTESIPRIRQKLQAYRDSVYKYNPKTLVLVACEGGSKYRTGNVSHWIWNDGLQDRIGAVNHEDAVDVIAAAIRKTEEVGENGRFDYRRLDS